jgi:hypothetical protein
VPPERSATPIVKRISSFCLPNDDSLKDLKELGVMLQQDLDQNDDDSCFADGLVDLLHEANGIFPDSVLPFPVNGDLLGQLPSTVYDTNRRCWNLPESFTEEVRSYVFLCKVKSDRKHGTDRQ